MLPTVLFAVVKLPKNHPPILKKKIPSEMEVAPRYKLLTLLTLLILLKLFKLFNVAKTLCPYIRES